MAATAEELAERVEFVPRFLVGTDKAGALRALHGEEELRENKIQALVWRHYPDKFWDWLAWRAEHREAEWPEGAKALGLLPARLRGALAAGEADELLKRDALLAERRRIVGTPTLVIGNQIYAGELQKLRLQSALCGMLGDPKPAACRDVPACFFDAQCRKPGFVGRCVNAGETNARCEYAPAVPVEALVLHDPDALQANYERICEVLTYDLPGLKPRLLSAFSLEGARLMKELKITRLPAYLLDPTARKEKGFIENLGGVTEKRGDFLLVKPETTGAGRLAQRRRVFGRADLFAARFSKAGQEAVESALAGIAELPPDSRPLLVFHDVIYWAETVGEDGKKRREPSAPGGVAELEEAARTAAVALLAPDKLNAYLLERGKRRGSAYWDLPLKTIGLDPEKIRSLADPPTLEIQKKLEAEADFIRELNAPGGVFLLAENCELLPLSSAKELAVRLAQIGRRGSERGDGAQP
jgi:hypothetical protein